MTKKTVRIECPFCKRRFTFGKAANHRKIHHPDLATEDFVIAIKRVKKKGQLKYKTYKLQEGKKSPMRTATDAMQDSRKRGKGVRSIVSGGAFESVKKQ
jgi:hypothetical protein